MTLHSYIIGTGSYLPEERISNTDFLENKFYTAQGIPNPKDTSAIISKLAEISGIEERRYVKKGVGTSDIAFLAAKDALQSSGVDAESLDYIIVAHNFANVCNNSKKQTDLMPNMAARVKHLLGIRNSNCVAYDIIFGCPGFVQAFIQADYYLRSGDAKRILVIGADILSASVDPHDVDSMLFADGAGAIILEAVESEEKKGVLSHKTVTDAVDKSMYLTMNTSRNPDLGDDIYIKMQGTSVFKYGVETVPGAIKATLDKAGLQLGDVNSFFIHQANARMVRAMLQKLADLYQLPTIPESFVPYSVQYLGNSSVATVPTLIDLVMKGKIEGHSFKKGDTAVIAAVGAGMHANSLIYRH